MNSWQSFPKCFARVVERQGDATAVVVQGRSILSYAQLFGRARAVAVRLMTLGVGRETIVGLGIEKSADYVASLLGVWFAGAAFVPLDPRLPPARARFMARQANVKVVLIGPGSEPPFDGLGLTACRADSFEEATDQASLPDVAPEDLAYIIFTSGSTGEPKGVMVEHRGIVNLLEAQIEAFELGPQSRALFYLSTNFDASVSDIGTALLSGAALHIEPPETLQPGAPLGAIMEQRGITHADLPPSLLRAMDPSQVPDCLKTVVMGGEACPPPVARRWGARLRVVNVYGPTEATVCSSLCVCDPVAYEHPLIGRPLPNVLYEILDADMNEVEPGTPGELFIGGIGLARGYAGRPDLTASRFIFRNGQRLYRTGDRVVRDGRGEIRFLGRLDRQVKIRGLLIEPEEVERRLMEHPGVRHAAVVKRAMLNPRGRPDAPNRDGLIAFIVLKGAGSSEAAPSHAQLSAFLARQLALWMLPQHYEFVNELPVTTSGKVDYARLFTCKLKPIGRAAPDAELLTGPGKVLADVWKQVLGVESVSPGDDFFGLGGDSLAALQATAASEACGLRVPPTLLAERWSLAEITAWLNRPAGLPPGAMSAGELQADIDFAPEWLDLLRSARVRAAESGRKPAVYFITGATGFLGSRLLAELLKRTDADVRCLVQTPHPAAALERVHTALTAHGAAATSAEAQRISIVHGDLSQPRFGLSSTDWERLATQVDMVYHCGASVNLVKAYEDLRPANVLGTREVLRLLCEGRRKRLHYASTLSVFVASDRNAGVLAESDDLAATRFVFGGYAQSKWAAERLLRAAANETGRISIYRFGLITGDSRTGYSAPRDHLALFVRGVMDLGCIPALGADRLKMDITPVDFAAAAMAHLSLKTVADKSPTWHLANPQPLSLGSLVDAINGCGASVQRVSDEQWKNRFEQRFGSVAADRAGMPEAAVAFLSLCRSLHSGAEAFSRYRTMDLFQATGIEFAMGSTLAALAGSGISCPAPDRVLLGNYVNRIMNSRRPIV